MRSLRRPSSRISGVAAVVFVGAQQGALVAAGSRPAIILLVLQDLALIGAAMISRLDVLLGIFVFLLPFGAVLQFGSGGAGRTILPLVGGLVAAAWLASVALRRRTIVRFPELKWLALFVLTTVVSGLFGKNLEISATPIQSFALFGMLTFLTVQIVRTWRQLVVLGWVVLASLTCVGLLMVLSATTGLRLGGVRDPLVYKSTFGTFSRYSSVAGAGPNTAGVLMALALLLCLGFYRTHRRRPGMQLLLLVMAAILAVAEVLSYSLAAVIGLTIGVALLAPRQTRSRSVLAAKRILVVASVVLFVTSPLTAFQQRVDLQADVINRQSSDHWGSQRVGLWLGAIKVIETWPLLGVGPGNGPSYIARSSNQQLDEATRLGGHNMYLEVGADMGLIGLAFFGYLTFTPTRQMAMLSRRRARQGSREEPITRSMFSCLVMIIIVGMTSGLQTYPHLWLIIGFALVIRRLHGVPQSPSLPDDTITSASDHCRSGGASDAVLALPEPRVTGRPE